MNNVVGIIGHLNSGQTLATMERYGTMDVVVITPTASEQSLTERGYTNFFRVNANDAVQAAVDATFLVEHRRLPTWSCTPTTTPSTGKGWQHRLSANWKQRAPLYRSHSRSLRARVATRRRSIQLRALSLDALFYAGYEIEAPYLRAELVEAGLDLPMLASEGPSWPPPLTSPMAPPKGCMSAPLRLVRGPSPTSRWIEAYQAVEYRNPDTYSVNGYVAMQVLAAGASEAKSTEAEAIADALRGNSVETLLDTLTFEETGDQRIPRSGSIRL